MPLILQYLDAQHASKTRTEAPAMVTPLNAELLDRYIPLYKRHARVSNEEFTKNAAHYLQNIAHWLAWHIHAFDIPVLFSPETIIKTGQIMVNKGATFQPHCLTVVMKFPTEPNGDVSSDAVKYMAAIDKCTKHGYPITAHAMTVMNSRSTRANTTVQFSLDRGTEADLLVVLKELQYALTLTKVEPPEPMQVVAGAVPVLIGVSFIIPVPGSRNKAEGYSIQSTSPALLGASMLNSLRNKAIKPLKVTCSVAVGSGRVEEFVTTLEPTTDTSVGKMQIKTAPHIGRAVIDGMLKLIEAHIPYALEPNNPMHIDYIRSTIRAQNPALPEDYFSTHDGVAAVDKALTYSTQLRAQRDEETKLRKEAISG